MSQGRRVALANKECLVLGRARCSWQAVRDAGTELLPVDCEHSAVFQAMAGADPASHRAHRADRLGRAVPHLEPGAAGRAPRPSRRCAIPTGRWGAKITIDSATLMNKGLELIEAYHLFPVEPAQLEVVVHPQSIVHCLVELPRRLDAGAAGQSRHAHADRPEPGLAARMAAPTKRLDLVELGQLSFERPDEDRFRPLAWRARPCSAAAWRPPC